MMELTRALPLSMTDVDVTGRTLEGTAWLWDTLYRVTDNGREFYQEGFLRGAVANSLVAHRNVYELRHEHWDERVGLVSFTEANEGLVFRAVIDHGEEGDRELADVNDHKRRGVSVRYTPRRNKPITGPPWWRAKVDLRELSLTARPQYGPDAQVALVRASTSRTWQRPPEVDALLAWELPAAR